jgi:hypothetical protein
MKQDVGNQRGGNDDKTTAELRLINRIAETIVQPSVIPIYEDPPDVPRGVKQIGTGVRIQHNGRHFLVTANHVLVGHSGNEEPRFKCIFVDGELRRLAHVGAANAYHHHDLAAVEIKSFGNEPCLPSSCLSQDEEGARLVSLIGYLARDFKRSLRDEALRPRPRIYTNKGAPYREGYVAMLHPKAAIDETTLKLIRAPVPAGMSGGPMLDANTLRKGNIRIIGIFTDYVHQKSLAYGETAHKVLELLEQMTASQSARIRHFVWGKYILPAREVGASEITIRAGDVHRDLGLVNSMPTVCNALRGSKLAELAEVTLLSSDGPHNGSNAFYRFALQPDQREGPHSLAVPSNPPKPKPRAKATSSNAAPTRQVDFTGSLVLVSCVKNKLHRPAPARDLYTSPLFQKMRALAERANVPWFILSAQHGLVAPNQEIAPYELTLNTMGVEIRREWAARVLNALLPHLQGIDRIVFLAGARYREFLEEPLRTKGLSVTIPMEGLSIGRQLSWLSREQ